MHPAPTRYALTAYAAGFVAALGSELATGKTVFEQVEAAPFAIAATFVVFTAASAVPVRTTCLPAQGRCNVGAVAVTGCQLICSKLASL
jgi:hypothetical protein